MKDKPNMPLDTGNGLIEKAKELAEAIIQGRLTPYQGARRIWWECQLKLETGDHRLDPFVYWASEYEEKSSKRRQALCVKGIQAAAISLIEKGTAL